MMRVVVLHHSTLCRDPASSHVAQVTGRAQDLLIRGTLQPVATTPGVVRSGDVVAARKLLRDVISCTADPHGLARAIRFHLPWQDHPTFRPALLKTRIFPDRCALLWPRP
jgi:hypothetical protein